MNGVLPNLGVYRDMPFGIENLVDRRDVTIGENNTAFYIALDPDYAARGSRMSAVTLREGEKNLSDVSDIEISAGGSSGGLTVEQVQQALAADTADLRTAMAADQDISGGPSSGTLELIKQLEQSVVDNVEQKVETEGNAPQQIQEIADDIEMVGATLNWADEHPESGRTPDVAAVDAVTGQAPLRERVPLPLRQPLLPPIFTLRQLRRGFSQMVRRRGQGLRRVRL